MVVRALLAMMILFVGLPSEARAQRKDFVLDHKTQSYKADRKVAGVKETAKKKKHRKHKNWQ